MTTSTIAIAPYDSVRLLATALQPATPRPVVAARRPEGPSGPTRARELHAGLTAIVLCGAISLGAAIGACFLCAGAQGEPRSASGRTPASAPPST